MTSSGACSRTHYAPALIFAAALVAGLSGPLNAQTFKPVDPLVFTKPFAGANPLPQILVVSGTAAALNFSAIASTSTGGTWLSVSPFGFCCTTPANFQVIVNAAVTLAAGTYTGQVVFSTATTSLTVPVTLVVAAPGAAFIDNMPGGLSFAAKTGSTSFTSQQLQVRNGGPGPLNWSVTATTFNNGAWLTVSQTSGTAPTFVTVGINAANLPNGGLVAGVFNGMLRFQSAGSTVTVPISATIGDNIFEQMNGLSFTKPFTGQDPLPQVLQVASTGTVFSFSADAVSATGGNWLTVSPSGFCCSTPSAVAVSVNPAITLAAGTYTAQVVLDRGDNSNAIVVPVSLTVAPPGSPFLDNMPGQLSFTVTTGGGNPPAQLVQVRNGGSGSLNWTLLASTFDNAGWLNVTPVNGLAPSFVSVSISVASLPNGGLIAGTFSGQLLFQDASSSVTVPISVVVSAGAAFEQINGLSFTKPFSGANPLPQTITAASLGSAFSFSAVAHAATGGNWLTVSPFGFCCNTPAVLTVSVNAAVTLAAGTYTGEIVLTGASNAIVVPVTLIVGAIAPNSPFFDDMAGQLSFSLKTAAGNPPSQQIQVRNGGSGSLDWTSSVSTSDGGNWLTISAPSGTAPSNVTIGIIAQNLPNAALVAGTFTGTVLFQSGGNTATVPISVTVGGNNFVQVNPISFTKTFGGANPLPQTLTLTSTGTAFAFSATASTATGGNWLSVSPFGFCCNTPAVLTVTVNPSVLLAAGTYTGEVVFDHVSQAITVPVTLTVAPAGGTVFDNVQGQMSFSSPLGGASLISQPITIRNAGSGTLNWDLVASTSDSGNWLTVSSTIGTAPATITVGIVPQNLPSLGLVAGHSTGQLLFRSSVGDVTVPVSVELGPNVFVQREGLIFTKAFGSPSPLSQTVTGSSTGTAFSYSATANSGNGGGWLTVAPFGFCCNTPAVNTASVNAGATFPGGTYTGQIVFDQGTRAMTVPVTLNVTGAPVAALGIAKTHTGNFTLGQANATYTVTVSNQAGAGATVGAVTVTETVPAGLTLVSMAGTGWACVTNTCTRNDALAGSSSYPAIAVTVNVAANAASPQINAVSVIGGGSPGANTTDSTIIVPPSVCTYQLSVAGAAFGSPGAAGAVGITAPAGCAWTADSAAAFVHITSATGGTGNGQVTYTVDANPTALQRSGSLLIAGQTSTILQGGSVTLPGAGLRFVPVAPCRIADTRNPVGAFGGPFLAAATPRDFNIPASVCGIPATAQAYSLNLTVVPLGPLGFLSVWPAGLPQPTVSTLNSGDGRIKANAAIVPAGTGGAITLFGSNPTHVIVDINGYFVPAAGNANLAFYPVTPCRITDTRLGIGTLAGPALSPSLPRSFPLLSGACGIPATAQAYALNMTVVPTGSLGFLSAWPTGLPQPGSSTLNAPTGAVTANAAIIPAGAGGAITLIATNATHVIIDINGYFAPPGSPGGMQFYAATPCRILDTRGAAGHFGGPRMAGGAQREFVVAASACGIPASAGAYSLNSTVVPPAGLGFLSLWGAGVQPTVSTLNAGDGTIVANAALVPASAIGSVTAFPSNATHLILDINGYFAQ